MPITMFFNAFVAWATLHATLALPSPTNDRKASQDVSSTKCNGKAYSYEYLAGFGSVPSNAKDKYGDTLGGFGSSIALDQRSWKKGNDGRYMGTLYALPDRGWNTQGTLNYQNRIQRFSISFLPSDSSKADEKSNLQLSYEDTILLNGPDGTPVTGLDPDVKGAISYPGFPDLPVATYTGDGFGGAGTGGKRVSLDTEGLVLANDGSFWISDEYGPYIYHFSSSGKMLQAIRPPDAIIPHRNGSVSFSAASPPIYAEDEVVEPEDPETGRANNQGLEGLTVSQDGKTLYALLQSALDQEGGPDDASRGQARLLEYDISSKMGEAKYKAEYVVTLPTFTSKKGKPKIAAQSEIHSVGGDRFFVLARDSGAGRGQDDTQSLYRHIDVFDLHAATNIKSKANDAVDGAVADKEGKLNKGITAAEYCPFLDFNDNEQLGRFGLHNGGAQDTGLLNEKWESLALAPVLDDKGKQQKGEWFLISVSDNDFVTQQGAMSGGELPYKDASGFDVDSQALIFRVSLPKGAKPS